MTLSPALAANFVLVMAATAVLVFFGILALFEVGRRVGKRRAAEDAEGARAGVGAVEGAVYGLLGLLLALTFSGAAARFEIRRALVIQEANAIGTAYLRIDLLPEDAQPALRDLFRRYLDSRLAAYARLPDLGAAMAELERSNALQREIWKAAQEAAARSPSPPRSHLIQPALNEMIDITTTRLAATRSRPPAVIFGMLIVLALVSALIAGHGMAVARTRHWLHPLAYALVMSVTLYVILDLEYPRLGLIRVDAVDQLLVDVRASMN
jgi:hypothetical protein